MCGNVWAGGFAPGQTSTFKTDLTLENSETISNSTDGSVAITTNSGALKVGIGVASPATFIHTDIGTGWGQLALDGSSGGCIMIRDTDDAGWTECSALNGTLSCSNDADGLCDGS